MGTTGALENVQADHTEISGSTKLDLQQASGFDLYFKFRVFFMHQSLPFLSSIHQNSAFVTYIQATYALISATDSFAVSFFCTSCEVGAYTSYTGLALYSASIPEYTWNRSLACEVNVIGLHA